MKQLLCVLAMGAAVVTTASTASADTFLPAGTSTTTFSGLVKVTGITGIAYCNVAVVVSTTPLDSSGKNQAYIQSFSFGSGGGSLCSGLSLWNNTHAITVSAPAAPPSGVTASELTFDDMGFTALPPCGPFDLKVTWLPGPPPRVRLTAASFPWSCPMEGDLIQTAAPWMTITN